MRKSAWGWTVVAGLLLVGCAHQKPSLAPPEDQPYRVGREDVLDVSVWRDPDLSRTVPVRPDGFISLPMVGELKAEGLTPVELAERIEKKLQPWVKEPRVTVIVREVNAPRVYVTGEVARPGAYPIRSRMTLLQAIALAGGFSDFAATGEIMLIRKDGQGIPVDYADLVADEDSERLGVYLSPGDTIVVP